MGRKRHSKAPIVTPPRGHKQCTWCGSVKTTAWFCKNRANRDGLSNHCRKCRSEQQRSRPGHAEYMREYRRKNAECVRGHHEKYKQTHPLRIRARYLLNLAVRHGLVVRPDQCSSCARTGKIEAHHDDYRKPFTVEWLCRGCHIERHKS